MFPNALLPSPPPCIPTSPPDIHTSIVTPPEGLSRTPSDKGLDEEHHPGSRRKWKETGRIPQRLAYLWWLFLPSPHSPAPRSEGLCPKDDTQGLRMERNWKTISLPPSRNS